MQLRDPKVQKILLVYFLLAGAVYLYFMSQAVPFAYQKRGQLLGEMQVKAAELEGQIQKAKVAVRDMAKLDSLTSHIKLDDVIAAGADIMSGKVRGRIVVDIA